ncbi:MAG: DnaA/Hda family protein [Lutispora sp.]|nr:DnaA/Hda family protein [Lutispora sp.]
MLKTALRNIAKTDYEIEFSILRENKEKATSNGETVIEVDEIRSSINSKYTFNSFVVGKNNKWAYKYTYEIAKNPYSQHKLLYIYGETGMGKTHLIQAAGNYILKHYPAVKLLYMSIEDFTRDMIDAIRYDNSQIFKQRILGYDVLLVDDLQFIAGKEFTQAEFFKTVSEFIDKGKQVIIASSRPPEEIKLMNERLTSMFELGGVFDIQVPDMDTRLEILKRRRIEDKIELSDEELVAVAEKTHGNVREMLNAYTRYVIYNQLVQEKAK